MATQADIDKLYGELKDKIEALKQKMETSRLREDINYVQTRLDEIKDAYEKAKKSNGDLTPIEANIRRLEGEFSYITRAPVAASSVPKTKLERFFSYIAESSPVFGIAAIAVAFLFLIFAIYKVIIVMGPESWQTISGGRAVLLLALTFAFVIFGGALVISPLFADYKTGFDERYRRSREVFLLFSGMFSTVVGFYFATASTTPGPIVVAEAFNAVKAELEVSVTGGSAPYTIKLEYGDKKAPLTDEKNLKAPGTVMFSISKEKWPVPMTITVNDSAGAKKAKEVTLDEEELVKAGFKKPQDEQKTTGKAAAAGPEIDKSDFNPKTGILAVVVKGGKPPYKVEAVYGKDNSTKPLTEKDKGKGLWELTFDKKKDWPLPLSVSVTDSEQDKAPVKKSVKVEEAALTKEGFKKP